jgi:RNA polymerase sigma-70 factor (ECF subfamily)
VIQETYLMAARKVEPYLRGEQRLPFSLWLRRVAADALHEVQRRHLDAQARDVRRELSPEDLAGAVSSESMAHVFVTDLTSPTQAAERSERKALVQRALDELEERDREIIALRFFERLTSHESARVLEISEVAARKRFTRAIARFRSLLGDLFAGEAPPRR